MRTVTLYTIGGRSQAELAAMRQLISRETCIQTPDLYFISAKNDYGRVYYGAIDTAAATGCVFVKSPWSRAKYIDFHGSATKWVEASEWEVKDLKKYARYLGVEKLTVLPAVRIFEDEIQALAARLQSPVNAPEAPQSAPGRAGRAVQQSRKSRSLRGAQEDV